MAERPALSKDGQSQPHETEESSNNSFWERISRVETELVEIRTMIDVLKEREY